MLLCSCFSSFCNKFAFKLRHQCSFLFHQFRFSYRQKALIIALHSTIKGTCSNFISSNSNYIVRIRNTYNVIRVTSVVHSRMILTNIKVFSFYIAELSSVYGIERSNCSARLLHTQKKPSQNLQPPAFAE